MKAISPAITHRAAAGLVALNVSSSDTVAATFAAFQARAPLEGVWVQHMFPGNVELLVTAFRDPEFGVIVGCGIGGGMTEVIDDVAFARAPIDADGAHDLLHTLRTVRRMPNLLSDFQAQRAANFIAGFSHARRQRALAQLHTGSEPPETRHGFSLRGGWTTVDRTLRPAAKNPEGAVGQSDTLAERPGRLICGSADRA